MNRTALTGSALGSLLIVSILLRAIFPGLAATPVGPQPSAVVTTPLAPPPDPAADGPWKAAQSYFAGWGPTPCPDPKNKTPREGIWCIPSSFAVRALIAIAPDPARTQMSLTFDRTLEGLQLAAQESGYVMDRYWLPWRVQTRTDGKDVSDSGDAKAREARLAQPGLVLFRKDDPASQPQAFFVFLVADTATTGIDGAQFRSAVAYLDEICATTGCSPDGRIRVVGPSFSGSLASLVRLTEALSPRKFTASSGSVSSLCAMADQRLLPNWDARCGKAPDQYQPRPNLIFKTFVHDTESAVERFVKRFYPDPANDCKQRPIAIFSEAATTFGGAVERQTTGAKDQGGQPAANFTDCIDNFVFPREIASLRNAARAATANAATSGSNTAALAPGQLPLDLTDRTNSNDAPPDFSTIQSPLSKEAVLMNMAAGMRRARYHYVGISGTNVLDVLFLTNFLRAACPDSRLFVISADLMFERELDNAPYIGMVAVTTYPLIEGLPAELDPTRPSSRLPFADEYERGQYHASLATLNELLGKSVAPTAPPLTLDHRPLWMMVVGTGGYWPVRILDDGADRSAPSLAGRDLSGAWIVLLILTSGIAALQTGVLLTASPFAPRFRDFALVSAVPRQRLFYIQGACATVALALALLLLPAWWHAATMTMILVKVVGTIALVAVVGAAMVLEALYIYRLRWTRKTGAASGQETSSSTLWLQLLTCLGVWTLAGGLLFAWGNLLGLEVEPDGGSLYGFFFAYRAVHLGSGVSPLTPLLPLLVAVYAWTCFEIWRLRFNDDMRPRLTPDGSGPDEAKRPRPGELTEKPIADAINRYLLKPGYVVPFTTVFAIWLAFLHPENPFQIFERTSFSVLYAVLFSLVVALMLSSGFRMAQIWIDLKRLLVEIDRRPIRAAFSRFKGISWSFWRQGGEDAEWAHMVRSLEAIAKLESGGRPRESGLPALKYFRDKISALTTDVDRIREQIAGGAAPSELKDDLAKLDQDIVKMQHTLSSGSGNLFLRSAIDDARACVTPSLDFATASGDPAVLHSLVDVLPARLHAALDVIDLAEVSAHAQDSTGAIWSVWQSTQKDRPLVSAVESLKEYATVTTPPSRVQSATSEIVPRVSRFYELETRFRDLQHSLATVLSKAWDVVESRQAKEALTLADPEERHELEAKDPAKLPPEARQLNLLEEFVALRYVTFIRGVLGHLRHVMIFLALSFSLALISLNIYSFEPHQSLIWSFTLIFIVTGAMVVGVLVQLHRDPILSRVTGTTGNALDLHFYLRIIAFAAVPLLTLLATHYPSIGRYLVSFLQPSLEALK